MKAITFHLKDELVEPFTEFLQDEERTMKWVCNKAMEEYLRKTGYIK